MIKSATEISRSSQGCLRQIHYRIYSRSVGKQVFSDRPIILVKSNTAASYPKMQLWYRYTLICAGVSKRVSISFSLSGGE